MTADPHINGQRIYYIRSAVEAIATKLDIELNFYGEPAGDGDDPALAAPSVQSGALIGPDQVPDVVHARHEVDVVHSRHDAPRDIPSSASGPATTSAADRTARAEYQDFTTNRVAEFDDLDETAQEDWRRAARRHLSAALRDPDDAIVAALREEFAYRMRTSAAHGHAGRVVELEDIDNAARCALAKARAAILGARGEEGDRG